MMTRVDYDNAERADDAVEILRANGIMATRLDNIGRAFTVVARAERTVVDSILPFYFRHGALYQSLATSEAW